MSKESADTSAASDYEADAPAAPKKRSKIKLALLAIVPLVLAGGGYAGWALYLAPWPLGEAAHAIEAKAGEHGATADGEGGHGEDPMTVSALPLEVLAETSSTHTYALSVLIAAKCGSPTVPALKAAAEEEAESNGMLVNLSWAAAARRTGGLSPKTCDYLWAEIDAAEAKLAHGAAPAQATASHH